MKTVITVINIPWVTVEAISTLFEPFTLGFIGKVLGWSEAECRILIAKVINDTRNKAVHMYVRFYFVYGQKPKEAVH